MKRISCMSRFWRRFRLRNLARPYNARDEDLANASLPVLTAASGAPFPIFPSPQKGNGAPGGATGDNAARWRTQIRGPPRATAGPLLPGVAAFGRAGPVT